MSSQTLADRALAVIPGGSQTLSKGPSQWVQSAPRFLECAKGAYVWDRDGQRYLDLPMALGAAILGHRNLAIQRAIEDQLYDGLSFSLPTLLETEVAERIVEMVPGVEQVRFCKNGSDATAAAIRLARIYTGREHVICTGYHGQQDWYMAGSQYDKGIPLAMGELIHPVDLDDLSAFRSYLRKEYEREMPIACVILEPANAYVPTAKHLQAVVDLAHEHGALVIFDEVITGFRLASGGAQEHFGVEADLVCFGKSLGNGMPISAVAGRKDIMQHAMFLSYTHGGETLSLAAARATLDVLATEPVHDHLWAAGGTLANGICNSIEKHKLSKWVRISGLAPRTIVQVREPHDESGYLPAKSLLQQELVKRGVLWNGNNFISYALTLDDVEFAIKAYDEALGVLAEALPDGVNERLEGPPIRQVFWQR